MLAESELEVGASAHPPAGRHGRPRPSFAWPELGRLPSCNAFHHGAHPPLGVMTISSPPSLVPLSLLC
eukprot:3683112-Rhodomonas_salina.1